MEICCTLTCTCLGLSFFLKGLGCDISPDGTSLAVGCRGGLVMINTINHSVKSSAQGYTNLNLGTSFSPSGTEIATGGDNSSVTLWDAETGYPKTMLQGHKGWIWCVKYSKDGSKLLSCSSDR